MCVDNVVVVVGDYMWVVKCGVLVFVVKWNEGVGVKVLMKDLFVDFV